MTIRDIGGPGGGAGSLNDTQRAVNDYVGDRFVQDYTLRTRGVSTPAAATTIFNAASSGSRFNALQLVITGVAGDTLTCRTLADDGTVGTDNIVIAKPYHLRKSVWETSTDFLEITGTSQNRQVKAIDPNNGDKEAIYNEVIFPAYVVTTLNGNEVDELGSVIWATLAQGSSQGGTNGLVDLNIEARRWKRSEPDFRYYRVESIYKDVLSCKAWDVTAATTVANTVAINIAKPWALRGSTWVTGTIGGVSYDSTDGTSETSGHTTRNGDPGTTDESQLIIPQYFTGETIIRAAFVQNGTGAFHSNVQAMWQDTNDDARAWAEAFV